MDWPCFETRGLFREFIEGRMRGKPTKWRTVQMLHDLAKKNGGYVALCFPYIPCVDSGFHKQQLLAPDTEHQVARTDK